MYISYYTLNYSQFSTENFDFFGTPSYWYFLISSVQWQFLTRRKKPHAILINTERMRSPRVQTFWWHLSNRDSRPGEFQPYARSQIFNQKSLCCYCHILWLLLTGISIFYLTQFTYCEKFSNNLSKAGQGSSKLD